MDKDQMIPTSTAIFVTNGMILKKSTSLWIHPSQAGQLGLLDKRHGLIRSDRTLRYHHLNHKNEGLTKRIPQRFPKGDGTHYAKPTKMCYTIAGYQRLVDLGNLWAKDWIKRLRKRYGPESDSAKRPPQGKVLETQDKVPPQHGKNPYLDPGSRGSLDLPEIPPFKTEKS